MLTSSKLTAVQVPSKTVKCGEPIKFRGGKRKTSNKKRFAFSLDGWGVKFWAVPSVRSTLSRLKVVVPMGEDNPNISTQDASFLPPRVIGICIYGPTPPMIMEFGVGEGLGLAGIFDGDDGVSLCIVTILRSLIRQRIDLIH
jgi:hypothetical protein